MSRFHLYFHTVRHLRPAQIVARLWRKARRPSPNLRPAPHKRDLSGSYAQPVPAVRTLIAPNTFRFLNVERRCANAGDWHPADATKLWTYHLHYFDDLNAEGSPHRAVWHRELLQRWVVENPPAAGDGWEPYPLSLRLANWVKWAARGNSLPALCHSSMAVQARWLGERLEYDIMGNHLLANAMALVHVGLYFEGVEAEQWYRRGIDILSRQLPEQVLADGGHFELSPMYHALVLEDLLDLINLLGAYGRQPPEIWFDIVDQMQRWLVLMSHPDGDIAFFNDAAFGVAPTPAELESYARRIGLQAASLQARPLEVLAASGYVRVMLGPACVICDCAAVGPAYQPGHGHADTCSFELSLGAQRVFVNSGVSEYGEQPERQRQRGTAAHNTVVVDGQDSSEVWGAFRVARRARAHLCEARVGEAAIVAACHDGYERLPGRNRHTRCWRLDEHSLRIEDHVSGDFQCAEAFFHLHPVIDARLSAAGTVILCSGQRALATVTFEGAAAVDVARGTWYPRFGVTVENSRIGVRFADASINSCVRWSQPQ